MNGVRSTNECCSVITSYARHSCSDCLMDHGLTDIRSVTDIGLSDRPQFVAEKATDPGLSDLSLKLFQDCRPAYRTVRPRTIGQSEREWGTCID